MPQTRTTSSNLPIDPMSLAMAGQQIMLDALRAELGALQALMPGLHRMEPPEEQSKRMTDTQDSAFDNMPV